MPIKRDEILRGPAIVQFDGATYYSKDDIGWKTVVDTDAINTSAHGKVTERILGRRFELNMTPIGAFANRAKLWPYGATLIGSSIYGGADKLLVIWTIPDGMKYQFTSAQITKMPDITFGTKATLCGPMTLTGIQKYNKDWSEADALYSEPTPANFNDASFNTADIVQSTYTGKWGAAGSEVGGFVSIETFEGFQVKFSMNLKPVETDSYGLLDYTLESLDVEVSCKPIGPTVAQIIASMGLQGTGAKRGRTLYGINSGKPLVISGDTAGLPKFTLNGAQIAGNDFAFGLATNRMGDLVWKASRVFAAGVAQPLFEVGVVPVS
jgi:hypothetical protein